jgi:threonine dehydrogenase-like Zn-dependent dehydrogenase
MQAIVLEQPEVLKKIELEAPQPPAPNDVLLKMKRLGVCGTDLHATKATSPFFHIREF